MSFESPNFLPAIPEMLLLAMACVVLVTDAVAGDRYRMVGYQLAQATLVATLVAVVLTFPEAPQVTFSGTFVLDGMAATLKAAILVVSFLAFFYARTYLRDSDVLKSEYYVLGLFAVLGMMVMASAHSLLTVYLGLELLSLSLYAMVAMNRDSAVASEAAMKYFVLGALASGMLLYGISMIYGATGTLDLGEIAAKVQGGGAPEMVLLFGLVFLVVGVAFKFGAVPFHMWVPDVYQGAPAPVTLFLGSAPKLAAFAMLIRLLVDGLQALHGDWQQMLMALAVLSMAVGNLVAIAQSNIKRMLAYSTIAHVGFLMLGLIAGTPAGYAAAMFYTVAYALMSAAGFGMVVVLSRSGTEAERLEDFKGLNERSPWLALMMLIVMSAMAGLPPFLGFWAKWSVIRELVAVGTIWLAVVAVLLSVVGAFYYLRVIRLMYFDKPDEVGPPAVNADGRLLVSTNSLAVLAFGIFPGGLMGLCASVLGA